jgi:hypothetical protein
MLINKWIAKLVLATTLFCVAGAPVLAQNPPPGGSVSQSTEIKNADGSQTEVDRKVNSDGTGSLTVDRDWSTGTWLAIGLGLVLLAGVGYAMTRRDDHFGRPISGVR